ncbi:hypothetical protein MMPV_007738 [Pyropia vietnamensis]
MRLFFNVGSPSALPPGAERMPFFLHDSDATGGGAATATPFCSVGIPVGAHADGGARETGERMLQRLHASRSARGRSVKSRGRKPRGRSASPNGLGGVMGVGVAVGSVVGSLAVGLALINPLL